MDPLCAEVAIAKAPGCHARSAQPRCGWGRSRDVQRLAARTRPGRLLQTVVACQRDTAADSAMAAPQPETVTDNSPADSSSAAAEPQAAADSDELWARLSLLTRCGVACTRFCSTPPCRRCM